jgi:hypothetical protein
VNPRNDLEPVLTALAKVHGMRLHIERPYFGYSQIAILKRPRS